MSRADLNDTGYSAVAWTFSGMTIFQRNLPGTGRVENIIT